jgi:DNA-binding MarR family transcriptional regulator
MSTSIFDLNRQDSVDRKISVGLERISQVLKTLIWEESLSSGLSPIQVQILVFLNFKGGCRVGDMADYFSLTPATISEALTSLENKELISRERGDEDKRTVWISLTPRGKRLAKKISGWANALEDVVKRLKKDEKVVVLKALVGIISELQNRGVIRVAEVCYNCKYFRPNVYKSSLKPHRCDYIGKPFGDADLRVDCPEYERTEAAVV